MRPVIHAARALSSVRPTEIQVRRCRDEVRTRWYGVGPMARGSRAATIRACRSSPRRSPDGRRPDRAPRRRAPRGRLAISAIRIVREYERVVVFRLGRLRGCRGPGLVLVLPSSSAPAWSTPGRHRGHPAAGPHHQGQRHDPRRGRGVLPRRGPRQGRARDPRLQARRAADRPDDLACHSRPARARRPAGQPERDQRASQADHRCRHRTLGRERGQGRDQGRRPAGHDEARDGSTSPSSCRSRPACASSRRGPSRRGRPSIP